MTETDDPVAGARGRSACLEPLCLVSWDDNGALGELQRRHLGVERQCFAAALNDVLSEHCRCSGYLEPHGDSILRAPTSGNTSIVRVTGTMMGS